MDEKQIRWALGAPAVALLLALGACGDHRGGVENTEMPVVERPNVEINRQGTEGATAETEPDKERRATAIMGGAGAGPEQGGVAMDARIVDEVRKVLQSDNELAGLKIDVSSQDGQVVLHGRAPDPAARERATHLVRGVREVKSVENLLTLG
jgi:hyperosmotically inducible periplasmic protein